MLGAVIHHGNNMDLQTKLSSIGVQKTADCIPMFLS